MSESVETPSNWDRFWFAESDGRQVSQVRCLLALITAVYFFSCWTDAAFWYTNDGPLSAVRLSTFLETADLESEASWIVSPLFLAKSLWIYHAYLVVCAVTAGVVAFGRGGRIAPWLLWLLFVGWANRTMFAGGLAETLISLGLFAAAIAPPRILFGSNSLGQEDMRCWTANFAERLIGVQISLFGLATFLTMLGGRIWFNGLGAYALAAPVQDRSIDWTNSWLGLTFVHETLTHLLLFALPVGFWLTWRQSTHRIGQTILLTWCLAIALLGSHWLYAAVFATMVLAIRSNSDDIATAMT